MLLMEAPVVVCIVGTPFACADGVKDGWRQVAAWTAKRLENRFGAGAKVDGKILISGGKISVSTIKKRLEDLGFHPKRSKSG